MEKRKRYSLAQLAPVFAAIICILMFNSFLIIKDGSSKESLAFNSTNLVNPLYFMENGPRKVQEQLQPVTSPLIEAAPQNMVASKKPETPAFTVEITNYSQAPVATEKQAGPPELAKDFQHVAFDELEASLTTEQKEQVKATVDATKKVLTTLQWQEVENSMADVLKKDEKAIAKQEYMKEVDAVNWKNIESNLKANYDNIDWIRVNSNIGTALTTIQLDSIQKSYTLLLTQLEKAERQISSAKATTATATPMPDRSLTDIKKAKEDLIRNIEAVKKMKLKPVIRL